MTAPMILFRIAAAVVLASIAASPAIAAAPPVTSHEVDKWGWSFRNFINDPCVPDSNFYTWERYRETFIGIPSDPIVNNGFDWLFFKAFYEKRIADAGNCYGMSLMSALINEKGGHLGYCAPVNTYSGDIVGVDDCNGDTKFQGPSDKALRRAIEEVHGHQLNLVSVQHYLEVLGSNNATSGDALYLDAKNEISKGRAVPISIIPDQFDIGGSGHTILGYRVEELANEKRIYVYDPNRTPADASDPLQRTWYLDGKNYIQIKDNNFKFQKKFDEADPDSYWKGGALGDGIAFALPISLIGPRDRNPASLGIAVTTLVNQLFVTGEDASLVQISDSEGRRLFKPGTRKLETDPSQGLLNTVPVYKSDGPDESAPAAGEEYVVLENAGGPLDVELKSGRAGYELAVGGRKSILSIKALGGSGQDQLRFEDVGTAEPSLALFNLAGADSFDVELSVVLEPRKRFRRFRLTKVVFPAGGFLELKVGRAADRLEAGSPLGKATFDLEIGSLVEGREQSVELPGVEVDPGQARLLRPGSWDDLDILPVINRSEEQPGAVERSIDILYGPAGGPVGTDFDAVRDLGGARGGSTTYDARSGVYTQVSSGEVIGNGGDSFQFAYRGMTGDFELTVEVLERIEPRAAFTLAGRHGLMARSDVSPASKYSQLQTAIGGDPRDGPRWSFRRSHGDDASAGDAQTLNDPPDQWPQFLKLVRLGDTFQGFVSRDGQVWQPVGSDSWHGLDPDQPILVGFASSSGQNAGGLPSTVRFKVLHLGPIEPELPLPLPDDGSSVGQPVLEATFAGPDGAAPGGFSVQRGAGAFTPRIVKGRLRLTDESATGSATSAFSTRILVDIDSAIYRFDFDLYLSRVAGEDPGEGLTFALLSGADGARVGLPGGGLGYSGLGREAGADASLSTNSFAVEFDTVSGPEGNEGVGSPGQPRKFHLGINSQNNTGSVAQTSAGLPDLFAPGGVHVQVTYDRGAVAVYLGQNGAGGGGELTLALETSVLPISFGALEESAVFGFTASTGDAAETAEVDNLVVTVIGCDDVPESAEVLGLPGDAVPLGSQVTLDGSASSAGAGDEGVVSLVWKVISGGASIVGPDNGPTVSLKTTAEGPVTVKLTADDGDCGNPASKQVTFNVGASQANWTRCDCSGDGGRDLTDPIAVLAWLYLGAGTPPCAEACDCNSDEALDLSDAIFDLTFQFLGGPPPAPPYPACDIFPGCGASCGTQ